MPTKAKSSKQKKLLAWLDSYEKVSAAVERHGDLLELLDAGGGIAKIQDFLPEFVANAILETLEGLDEQEWNATEATDDYAHNNISHEFLSTKSEVLEAVFRVLTLLLPDSLFTFSAAKYCRQGHIKPHDDRAYTQVCMEDGSIQLCSRNIAVIYYLTKGWTAADGGALIDHEAPGGPQTHVPRFNSIVAFTIPRWHEVTPVLTDKPRYSIFGWFLEPGKLYDLQLEPNPPVQPPTHTEQQQEPSQQQGQQQQRQPSKHKKKQQAQPAGSPPEQLKPQPPHRSKKKRKRTAAEGGVVQAQQQQQQQQLAAPPAAQQQRTAAGSARQQQVAAARTPHKLPGLKADSKPKRPKHKTKDATKQ